jgi:Protein of unknown function (DUF3303)
MMVVERFLRGARPVYERLQEGGRGLPQGVVYIDSWVDQDLGRCWQLMEVDDSEALRTWMAAWGDLVSFEVVPVVTSREAKQRALGREAAPSQQAEDPA